MTANLVDLKQRAVEAVDAMREELITLSLEIHANPELAFKEFRAAELLGGALERHGFRVERGVGELETAFRATADGRAAASRGEGPTVALLAEYDALPGIGHACGHNIMGASCVGAAVAVAAVLDRLPGQIMVVGTPAEENGGGKAVLLKRGALDGIDAAIAVHPAARNMVDRPSLAEFEVVFEFAGRASHAAAAPFEGINALEAVIQTFNNINGQRLHYKTDARVHGIITAGGQAINIVPDYAAARFSVRARSQGYAAELVERVTACARAAETATGAKLTLTVIPGYAAMIPNAAMAAAFAENWRSIGIEIDPVRPDERMGSTDMGDVSQRIPAIHPYIAIVPEGVAVHTIEFREAAASPAGHAGLIAAAKGMAMTSIDLLGDVELLQRAREDFRVAAS